MQVFKLYFKIFKKAALATTIMYVVIFGAIATLFSKSTSNPANVSFETTKYDVAIINNDDSEFSDMLEKYVVEHSEIVEIDTSNEGIKDALFYRAAEYILIIPKGFGNAFLNDKSINLETYKIPDSTAGIFMDIMVNNYLKTFNLYLMGTENLTINQIYDKVQSDLGIETTVNIQNQEINEKEDSKVYCFNYLPYPLLCVMILSISIVMFTINKNDVKRRNLCAPINGTNFSMQIFLGNAVLAFIFWIFFTALSSIISGISVFSSHGMLMTINTLVFVIVCLGLSFLIGNVATKKTVNPIANTVALGSCFISGAFIPQSMLSDTVQNIGACTPVFWYVKCNNTINALNIFDFETLKPILGYMLIQLAFAAAFLAIGLVIIKQKRTSN